MNSSIGSSLDDFLREEELLEEAEEVALQRVIAWQLDQERRRLALSKSALAERMGTSRSQLDRILGGTETDVRLETLNRAARALGKRIEIRLV
ncbi:MAG TPA: helix-turn-helix transcriptional regulator [Thermomicrobiales bacterium]|jgi:antitoxin HicB|nr:helix-turn-helix transcriptional regulator [Thermomicrobiales bacterium]